MTKKKSKNKKKTKLKKKIINRKIKHIKNKNSDEEELVIKVPKHWAKKAYANKNSYQKKYNHSVRKNEDFWRK